MRFLVGRAHSFKPRIVRDHHYRGQDRLTYTSAFCLFVRPQMTILCSMTQEKLKSANLIKILRLVMFMLLVAHWIACGWNLQASYVSPAETWRDNIDERVNGERVSLYLISLYTAFLMLVGGNPAWGEKSYDALSLFLFFFFQQPIRVRFVISFSLVLSAALIYTYTASKTSWCLVN